MALANELMAGSIPAGAAGAIGQDTPATGLTATGSNQAGALALTSSFSIFSTVASSTGAILPPAGNQNDFVVYNGGANPLTVYPAVGQQINGLAANTGLSVAANKSAIFIAAGNQWIGNVSA